MAAYVKWVGFDFCRNDYLALFDYLRGKCLSLKMRIGELDRQLFTFEDLDIWRQEVAYGLPFDEHKNLLSKYNELEQRFRGLLEKGFEREAYAVYDKLLDAQTALQLFISNKNMVKNNIFPFYSGLFSQWHKSKFVVNGIEFNCAEQYMMYNKALLFGDVKSAEKILLSGASSSQKNLDD